MIPGETRQIGCWISILCTVLPTFLSPLFWNATYTVSSPNTPPLAYSILPRVCAPLPNLIIDSIIDTGKASASDDSL